MINRSIQELRERAKAPFPSTAVSVVRKACGQTNHASHSIANSWGLETKDHEVFVARLLAGTVIYALGGVDGAQSSTEMTGSWIRVEVSGLRKLRPASNEVWLAGWLVAKSLDGEHQVFSDKDAFYVDIISLVPHVSVERIGKPRKGADGSE